MCQATVIVTYSSPVHLYRVTFLSIADYNPFLAGRPSAALFFQPFGIGFPVGSIPGSCFRMKLCSIIYKHLFCLAAHYIKNLTCVFFLIEPVPSRFLLHRVIYRYLLFKQVFYLSLGDTKIDLIHGRNQVFCLYDTNI
jgi:hypothetical protein